MKITVCIGSSCCIKGSYDVVEELKKLINNNDLDGKIELCGSFCMDNCVNGVCVDIDGKIFSVKPEETKTFFEKEVIGGEKNVRVS